MLLILLCNAVVHAQTTIQGHITDDKGQGISDIPVILRQLSDSTISDYGYSDDKGKYQLTYKGNDKKLLISISGMEIAPQYREIDNQDQTIDFRAVRKTIKLKEVVIKSAKIWGNKDTVNYLVSSFIDKKDIVIADVLKKMPGINIEESGEIRYQGKPINKFYIENLDMLQGRYGIATNNISAKDVSTVQVLENHQPIKALDNIKISGEAAINLKLKEGAKGTLSMMAQPGLGIAPLLWENELTAMYFAKKYQNITTYKSNNSGMDLSNELRSFTIGNFFENENILHVVMPSSPAIDKKRYLFNNSNAVTINNLKKTKKNADLNFNFIYFNDHENRKNNARTTYYIPNRDVLVVDEIMKSSANIDRLETELRYSRNEATFFLNNYLNIEGIRERNAGNIYQDETISQLLTKPSLKITNSFHWVKKTSEEKGIELRSNVGFKSGPQTLSIIPGQYSEIFNEGENYITLRQKVRINSFYLNNKLAILSPLMAGNIRIDPNFEFNFESRDLYSNIYTKAENEDFIANPVDSMKNDMDWIKYTAGAGLNIRYNTIQNLKVTLNLPFYFMVTHINNKIMSDEDNIHRFFFQPFVDVSYDLSTNTKLKGGYRFYNQIGSMESMYTGYILQNYRSLNHYKGNLAESKGNGGYINVSYKNLIHMFFADGDINYNYLKKNLQYAQNFNGILSIISAIKQNNSQQRISVNGRISKGFDWKNSLIGLEANYGIYTTELLRQNNQADYKINRLNIAGSINGKPLPFMIFSYKGIWSRSTGKINANETMPAIKSLVNHLSLTIDLPKGLALNTNYEHYYNSASPGNKNLSFTDIGLTYNRKTVNYRLSWNNIFNTDNYVSAYYDEMNTYQQLYHIRPGNVILVVKFKLK